MCSMKSGSSWTGMKEIVMCLIIFLIAIGFFILSLICLGGANDAYEKYPGGKIVAIKSLHSLQSQISWSSLQLSSSLYSGETEGEELLSEEEKEEEKVEVTRVMFLWHYTSAAVCFTIFIFLISLGTVIWIAGTILGFALSFIALLIAVGAALLTVLPAVRMDEFSTGTYWVWFIPYFVAALVYFALVVVYWAHNSSAHSVVLTIAGVVLLAGLILYILRLEGILPPSFKYAFIFVLPTVAVAVAAYPVWALFDYNKVTRTVVVVVVGCAAAVVLYGGFFLPFSLRKDQVFHTSYLYTLIPWGVLGLALIVVPIYCLRDEMSRR